MGESGHLYSTLGRYSLQLGQLWERIAGNYKLCISLSRCVCVHPKYYTFVSQMYTFVLLGRDSITLPVVRLGLALVLICQMKPDS